MHRYHIGVFLLSSFLLSPSPRSCSRRQIASRDEELHKHLASLHGADRDTLEPWVEQDGAQGVNAPRKESDRKGNKRQGLGRDTHSWARVAAFFGLGGMDYSWRQANSACPVAASPHLTPDDGTEGRNRLGETVNQLNHDRQLTSH